MRVLIIGGGGREHAIARAVAQSPRLTALFALPGNPGIESMATLVPGKPDDIGLALEVARRESIDLTIVGPEDPLAAGMVDAFESAGLRVFGPTRAAAQLESDKAYAKRLMRIASIPTADARVFTDYAPARTYLASRDEPVVLKASGLARGKGVLLIDDPAEAIVAAERIMCDRVFGDAGATLLVEEKLNGYEVSVFAIVDGRSIYLLESARDHKRLLDGDEGPNTGGMGAYSMSDMLSESMLREVQTNIVVPIVDAVSSDGAPFRGVLFVGLMVTAAGPKVLEFNVRFGDPEAQAILPRMRSDLLELIDLATRGRLDSAQVDWDPRAALTVTLASAGYPDNPRIGVPITGLPDDAGRDDLLVFHAGVARQNGRLVTAGGRVLNVTALGDSLAQAREVAYAAIERVEFDGAQYRRDIGLPKD